MLSKTLKFFGVKDNNLFLAKFFGGLSFLTLIYIFVSFISFLLGEARIKNISPLIFAALLTFPPLAYSYASNTKLFKNSDIKIKWFIATVSTFGIIVSCFVINVLNGVIWWGLERLPSYADVMREYPSVFGPSIKTICLLIPFVFIFRTIDFFLLIYREEDLTKGISAFDGLSANITKSDSGPFSCETTICTDVSSAKPI